MLHSKLSKSDISRHTTNTGVKFGNKYLLGLEVHTNEDIRYYMIHNKCHMSLATLLSSPECNLETFMRCIEDVIDDIAILLKRDIVHNNVCPSTILLHNGRFKLACWGKSRTRAEVLDTDVWKTTYALTYLVQNVMIPQDNKRERLCTRFATKYLKTWKHHESEFARSRDICNVGLMLYSYYISHTQRNDLYFFAHDICSLHYGLRCLLSFKNRIHKTQRNKVDCGQHGRVYPLRVVSPTHPTHFHNVCNTVGAKLVVHTNNGSFVVSKCDLLKCIQTDHMHVLKEFLPKPFFRNAHKKTFQEELRNLFTINIIYINRRQYTSLPCLTYKKQTIYAISVANNYTIINLRGNYNIDASLFDVCMLRELYTDIRNSFIILHSNEYIHRDVKPENIVYFDKKPCFRLIDWQKLCKVSSYNSKYLYHGSKKTGSPVSFFLEGNSSANHAIHVISESNLHIYDALSTNPVFQKRYKDIMKMFHKEFTTTTKEQIFKKWKFNIDLFGFGMSLLYVMHMNHIQDNYIENIAYNLLSSRHILHTPSLT